MAERVQRASWWRRAWRRVSDPFRGGSRRATAEEAGLVQEAAGLRRRLEDAEEDCRTYRRDLDLARAEIRVKDLEIQGMAKVIAMHETRWDAETAQQAKRQGSALRARGEG